MYIEIKTVKCSGPNKVLLVFGGGPVLIMRTVGVYSCRVI